MNLYLWKVLVVPIILLCTSIAFHAAVLYFTVRSFDFVASNNHTFAMLDNASLAADLATNVVTTGEHNIPLLSHTS